MYLVNIRNLYGYADGYQTDDLKIIESLAKKNCQRQRRLQYCQGKRQDERKMSNFRNHCSLLSLFDSAFAASCSCLA